MVKTTRTDAQLKFRVPAELKERIQAAADEQGRSMNAEIVARLESSFAEGEPRLTPEKIREVVEILMEPERDRLDAQLKQMRDEMDRMRNAAKGFSGLTKTIADDD